MEVNRLTLSEILAICKVRTGRRFEMQELCEVFVGKPAGLLCTLLIAAYLCNWSTVVIAATAMASNVPVSDHGTFLARCSADDFRYRLHPVGPCWNTYSFTVLVFGALALVVALAELGEMWVMQTVLGIVRFVTIGSMIGYSIVAEVIHKEDVPDVELPWFQFSLNGWLAAIPVMVYNHLTVVGIPTISDPVANKRGLAKMWGGVFFTTSVLSAVLGITVAIHFKSQVNEVASLNWVCEHQIRLI